MVVGFDSPSTWMIAAIVIVTVASLIASLALLLNHGRREKAIAFQVKKFGPAINLFIETGDISTISNLSLPLLLKPFLLAIGQSLKGEYRHRFLIMYRQCGLLNYDCNLLLKAKGSKVAKTLGEARTLELDLPEVVLLSLMKHRNRQVRWAAAEYASTLKPQKMFTSLVSFLTNPIDYNEGLCQFVLFNLAKKAAAHFSYLTDFPQAPNLNFAILRILSIVPIAGAERFILKSMRRSSQDGLILAGLGAMVSRPHESYVNSLLLLSWHPNPMVRSMVAQTFRDYVPSNKITSSLLRLSRDGDARVKNRALETIDVHQNNEKSYQVVIVDSLTLDPAKFSLRRSQ